MSRGLDMRARRACARRGIWRGSKENIRAHKGLIFFTFFEIGLHSQIFRKKTRGRRPISKKAKTTNQKTGLKIRGDSGSTPVARGGSGAKAPLLQVPRARNKASSCPRMFSRTLCFYYVASSPGSPLPHLLDGHRKLVGRSAIPASHAQCQL